MRADELCFVVSTSRVSLQKETEKRVLREFPGPSPPRARPSTSTSKMELVDRALETALPASPFQSVAKLNGSTPAACSPVPSIVAAISSYPSRLCRLASASPDAGAPRL
ncbi:hypothetical protein BRADI_2g53655v3 [Brachypodium distachyon]|uniref:Uncharacterized protein n=1 Tax=Brachypodium distachyon TaxID=15368 RepID=A0A2K2DFR6_BRADI|nr:hypothetical protein BRADI_2g53655v3 [Brachypodium distachyon]